MNRRITTSLLVACVISGVCTYWLGRKVKLATAAHDQRQLRYVAATRALEAGEVLHATDLTWVYWPIGSPLQGALSVVDMVPGRVALYPLEKGQPILERYLADPGIGAGLASRIPDGKRALALRSDDVVGVAGFLAPGSRVDVLVTYRPGTSSEPLTATVLENAEVLAAGQRTEPDPTGKPASATVVTLLVTPLEAERAVLASTQGTVHFVLRNGLDKAEVGSGPISLAWLGAGPASGPEDAPMDKNSNALAPGAATRARWWARRPRRVEVVLGGQLNGDARESGNSSAAGLQP